MKRFLMPFVLLLAATVSAQQKVIEHTPASCMPSESNAVMRINLNSKGEPRVYFRREGAETWCWVRGTRLGDKAVFVLPKFEAGPIIDYYFVTVDEHDEVTAKSPEVYHVRSAEQCTAMEARHLEYVLTQCEGGGAALGTNMGAGLQIRTGPEPVPQSPSVPNQ